MRVVLVGLSHKTAPVELREKLSLYGRSPADALHRLRDATPLEECAILSTCNRLEVYGITRDEDWQEGVLRFLAHQGGVTPGVLQDHLYSFEGTPACRHLFRVACGLDSMVVGEGQILAQVRDALQCAQEAGTAGTLIHALCQHALRSGKRARTETEIGRGAVSISLAAVKLARQIFQPLKNRIVLLVGAGEMGKTTARLLLTEGDAPSLHVCNRTAARAEELARRFGGTASSWGDLEGALRQADIVLSSTGASEPVVRLEMMRRVMRARRGRPLLLIDIAVPRDFEPAVGGLDDVYLYNIDDLQEVVEKNLEGRQAEVAQVEAIIQEDLARYSSWMRGLEVGPTIQQLQALAQGIVAGEMERVGGRLAHLSERDRNVVDAMVRGVVNKLLRPPILHLRAAAESGNGYHEVEHVRAVFGLHSAEPADADGVAATQGSPERDTGAPGTAVGHTGDPE